MKNYFAALTLTFLFVPAFADRPIEDQILSVDEWDQLTADEKVQALDQAQTESQEINITTDLKDPILRAELERAAAELVDSVDQEVIESDLDNMESIFTIGGPSLSEWVEVFTINSTTVAVHLTLWQRGGSNPSDQEPPQKHYATEAEALADGMDVNADVSWQLHSYFEYVDGKLKPLKIDIYGEGGFSWTGW